MCQYFLITNKKFLAWSCLKQHLVAKQWSCWHFRSSCSTHDAPTILRIAQCFTPKVIQFFAYDFLKALYVHAAEISAAEAMLGNILACVWSILSFPCLERGILYRRHCKGLGDTLNIPVAGSQSTDLALRQSIPVVRFQAVNHLIMWLPQFIPFWLGVTLISFQCILVLQFLFWQVAQSRLRACGGGVGMVPELSGWNSKVLWPPRDLFAMVLCADSNRLFESLGSLLFLAWWCPCVICPLCSRPCSLPVDTTLRNLHHSLHRAMHTHCMYMWYMHIQLWTVSTFGKISAQLGLA